MPELFRERKWDLVGLRNLWFAISGVTIAAGLYFLIAHGLNWGIDFRTGAHFRYQVGRSIPAAQQVEAVQELRSALASAGIEAEVQFAGNDQVFLRTKAENQTQLEQEEPKVSEVVKAKFPNAALAESALVGPVVQKALLTKALIGTILGMLLVLGWVSIRYDFKYAICAIAALAHDILVLVGGFAILHREINSWFVAAVLTVVGYSVHDTIVIFDRIRENVKLRKRGTFPEVVNISLLETMARSVNTILTVEFTLFAIFLLGGSTLHDFALAMIIGVTTGGYSSIFNASQLLVVWKQREAARQGVKRAPARIAPAAEPPRRVPRLATPPSEPAPELAANGQIEEAASQQAGGARATATQPRKLKAAKKRKKRF